MMETKRLVLREFDADDAEFTYRLMSSPEYIENIGDRGINSVEAARTFLVERIMASYKKHGYGLYAVTLKSTGQVIGMSGLVRRDNLPTADIGFGFLTEFTGQGYALEASERVMTFAQEELSLDPVLAITDKTNERSIRLLKKLGLSYETPIDWDGEEILLLSTRAEQPQT